MLSGCSVPACLVPYSKADVMVMGVCSGRTSLPHGGQEAERGKKKASRTVRHPQLPAPLGPASASWVSPPKVLGGAESSAPSWGPSLQHMSLLGRHFISQP
jgi:hypothetical protein